MPKISIKLPKLTKEDRVFYKVDADFEGDNWLLCFGQEEEDGKTYSITTNFVHASELSNVSQGAKGDAELICYVLNLLANGKIKL